MHIAQSGIITSSSFISTILLSNFYLNIKFYAINAVHKKIIL